MTVDVNKVKCISCGGCVGVCPVHALDLVDRYPDCNTACTNCKACVMFCPVEALSLTKGQATSVAVKS